MRHTRCTVDVPTICAWLTVVAWLAAVAWSVLPARRVISATRWERTRTLLALQLQAERPCRPHPCACRAVYEREPCSRRGYTMCPLRARLVCATCWDLCTEEAPRWVVVRQETKRGEGPFAEWPAVYAHGDHERVEEVEHYEIDIFDRLYWTQETRGVAWSDYRRRWVGDSSEP